VVTQRHKPVLASEVVQALNIKSNGIYIDATFGRGGHSSAILDLLADQGRLIVIDQDPDAVAAARSMLARDHRVIILHRRFSELKQATEPMSISGKVNGIVFDLGVSSPQLDDATRGFSFSDDGPLDMRMDPQTGVPAKEWLETVDVKELEQVIRELGEERYAKRIASAIVTARQQRPIQRTYQLVEIIEEAVTKRDPHKHPATRTFQAIRMFLNQELEQLREALPQAVEILTAGGRLVVVSFHSLEDRIVKRFLRQESKGDPYPPDFPIPDSRLTPRLRLIGRPIRPGQDEVSRNPRARSAVMRVAERTEAAYA
jgi:16S rRNA (cytosine1402-N4)-methyltransferase